MSVYMWVSVFVFSLSLWTSGSRPFPDPAHHQSPPFSLLFRFCLQSGMKCPNFPQIKHFLPLLPFPSPLAYPLPRPWLWLCPWYIVIFPCGWPWSMVSCTIWIFTAVSSLYSIFLFSFSLNLFLECLANLSTAINLPVLQSIQCFLTLDYIPGSSSWK